jgi:hypothetical protein
LLTQLGPGRLRKSLDQFDLWRDQNHVEIKKVLGDLATSLYLPRLRDRQLLIDAVRSAIRQLVCDHFAYAESFEEGRYVGLVATGGGATVIDLSGVIVKPDVALAQLATTPGVTPPMQPGGGVEGTAPAPQPPVTPTLPRWFYASASIDPIRAGRDVGRIAEEVLQHLTTLPRANVKLTLEIEAYAPDGVPDDVQRVVTENCQTLKFSSHGFE